jgi:hypothetical protein
MIGFLVLGGLVGIVVVLALRNTVGRQSVLKVWRPTLALFRAFRLFTLLAIAFALWVSGRPVLQAVAVVGVVFVAIYVWLEQPQSAFE